MTIPEITDHEIELELRGLAEYRQAHGLQADAIAEHEARTIVRRLQAGEAP